MAYEFSINIYRVTSKFPADERYNLTGQLRRSAISIAANIAEGKGRNSDKELNRFLYIARGSLEESKSHLLIAKGLGYVEDSDYKILVKEVHDLGFALNKMIKSVKKSFSATEQSEELSNEAKAKY